MVKIESAPITPEFEIFLIAKMIVSFPSTSASFRIAADKLTVLSL